MDEQIPLVVRVLVGASLIGAAWALHVITRRAADGRLGRSQLVGLRTAGTLRSDEAWRAGHQAGRRSNDVGSAGLTLAGIVVLLHGGGVAVLAAGSVAGAVWVLSWLLRARGQADRAARAAQARHPRDG